MKIPVLDEQQIIENLNAKKNPFFAEYYAFYSSWFGGITTNPHLMHLPIDDHMVHRGDGVFEAMKVVGGKIYMFDEHLERLMYSANAIELKPDFSLAHIKEVVHETLRVANRDEAFIRIYLGRGPGSFSVNPYDTVGVQLYVVVTQFKRMPKEKYERGVVIGKSAIPIKDSWLARVKSCNYLPNVMMKKEAVDRKLDFVIGIDEQGFIAEGPTENIMIVDARGVIVHPTLDNILKGITMTRICELAHKRGIKVEVKPISVADLQAAQEVMMCGTTLDVIPVVQYEEHIIGDGKPGHMAQALREFLIDDMDSTA